MHNLGLGLGISYRFLLLPLGFSSHHAENIPRLAYWFQEMDEGHTEHKRPTKLSQPSEI